MTITKLHLVMSNPEAAEALEVSLWTLDRYRRRGWLVPITDRRSGRVPAYCRKDVERVKARLNDAEFSRPKPEAGV
jgi:DNA-binding transcriptional MerR regulator